MSSFATDPGPTLLGPFEITHPIAEGASSRVVAARDRRNNSTVALKIAKDASPSTTLSFRRELLHARRIHHPNVVRVHELLVIEGRSVLSMEYVAGVTFSEAVRAVANDEARVKRLFAALVLATDAVHDVGLVHLDVKDENVRVTEDGRLVLLDLGIARGIDEARLGLESSQGTRAFMAPEQAALLPLGPAADTYAMGVLLHFALCGSFPEAGTPSESLALQVTRKLSHVGTDLRSLVTRLLDPEPGRRPSARAILRALNEDPTRASSAASSLLRGQVGLIGRKHELSLLNESLAEARDRPVLVSLSGPRGVGKRSIIEHAARAWQADGTVVLRVARRYRGEAPSGWEECSSLLEQLVRALDQRGAAMSKECLRAVRHAALLCPSLARLSERAEKTLPTDPLERGYVAFEAVRTLFEALGEQGTFVLVLAHDGPTDPDLLRLLGFVLSTSQPNVLIACTSTETPEPLGPLSFREIAVAPLAEPDTRALLTKLVELSGCESDARLLDRAAASGHPLFLLELVRHRAFFGASSVLPSSIEQALELRVNTLEPTTRKLLFIIASSPIPLDRDTLSAALSLPLLELERSLNALRVLGLVVFSEWQAHDVVSPAHGAIADLLCTLLRSQLPDADALLHHALAAHRTRYPVYLAEHRVREGEPEHAASLLEEEAERARLVLAFHREERLRRAALALVPARDAQDPGRLVAYADSARFAGLLPRAAQAYADAATQAKAAEKVSLLGLSASCLLRAGRVDEARAALEATLAQVGQKLPRTPRGALVSVALGRALLSVFGLRYKERRASEIAARDLEQFDTLWSVGGLLALIDTFGGASLQIAAVRSALRLGEPSRVALSLAQESLFRAGVDAPPMTASRELVKRARELASRTQDPRVLGACIGAQGIQLSMCGEPRRSNVLLVEAEKHLASAGGADATLSLVRSFRVINHVFLGQARALSTFYPGYARRAVERGDRYEEASLITAGGYLLPLFAKRPEDALALIDHAERTFVTPGFQHQHFQALIARLLVLSYVDPKAGHVLLESKLSALRGSMLMRLPRARLLVHALGSQLALAASLAGGEDEKALLSRARKHARQVDAMGFPEANAFAFALRGHLAVRDGQQDQAVRLLEDAVRAFEKLGHFEGWLNTYRLGRLVGGDEGRRRREQALSELGKRGAFDPKWLSVSSLGRLYE